MINSSKQDWSVGSTVKVGFMTLVVDEVIAEYDGLPDIYQLHDPRNNKKYEFIPHVGLNKIW